jgi:hypothetical protein
MIPNLRRTTLCSAILLSLTLAACSSSGGRQGDAPPGALASNPFAPAGARSYDEVRVGTLRVFGDSYSALDFTETRRTLNWAKELHGRGRANDLELYAIGGARAAKGTSTAFDKQVETFRSGGTPVGDGDLSVVYFGYNDIGRNGSSDNLRAARAGYFDGINQLIAAGATDGRNRIFVTQIHDWSRNPNASDSTAGQVVAWNNFVAEQANANPNIVAVDLYTVLNRIYEDPVRFGFTNVTSSSRGGSAIDYLYFDGTHFGNRGQTVISRTFEHYITRGWEWASTVSAGAEAAARLNQDIDRELLVLSYADRQQPVTGLQLHVLGNPKQSSVGSVFDASTALGHVAQLNADSLSRQSDPVRRGLAMSYRPQGGTGLSGGRFGVAFSNTETPRYFSDQFSPLAQKNDISTTSVYWQQAFGNFNLTAHAAHLRTRYENHKFDDLLNDRFTNTGTGTTWSFEQKLRHTSRQGGVWLSPWVSVTHLSHQLDPMLGRSLYTTDVQYNARRTGEWQSALGLDVQSEAIDLGKQRSLRLSAGVLHRTSLQRDPVRVSMRETGGIGAVQRESIARPTLRETELQLDAQLQLTRQVDMLATFAAIRGDGRNDQRFNLLTRIRF